MTNISEIGNLPRTITLGDKTLQIRQLKLKESFGFFEKKIKDKKIKEAQEISKSLSKEERQEFLIKVWNELPSGEKITDMAVDLMCSMEGVADMIYMAAKDYDENLTVKDIESLINIDNINELSSIVKWLNGKEEGDEEETEEDAKTEKKNK